MEEQLEVLIKNHFGSQHESTSEEVIGQTAMLFDEPEVYAHIENIQQETPKAPEQNSSRKKQAFGISFRKALKL